MDEQSFNVFNNAIFRGMFILSFVFFL